ncbi:hypothetical protein BGX27_001055, partial [Mortierella sp. AM989]
QHKFINTTRILSNMATLVSQIPIALANPFSPLGYETHQAIHFPTNSIGPTSAEAMSHPLDEDLDLSSWCVVNSFCSSDGEEPCEVEQDEDEEIYLWQAPSTEYGSCLPPLRLSSSEDGFTHISKATIAHSTNSGSATALEHRGTWVVKVSKKRNKPQDIGDNLKQFPTATSTPPYSIFTTAPEAVAMNPSEKRKETSTNVASNGGNGVEAAETSPLYMSMTEHELSKSSKAAKIKNSRVATQHDRDLAKALGCLSEDTDKIDKKAIRSRSNGKSNTKSSRANKSKIIPTEF